MEFSNSSNCVRAVARPTTIFKRQLGPPGDRTPFPPSAPLSVTVTLLDELENSKIN